MTTNATNETQYFHFPLFASGDKPSWLTDWNGTVEELDNILEQYRVSIQANTQGMESFNEQIAVIRDSINTVNERLSNDESTIEDIQSAINGFNTALIQADTSIKELTAWKNNTTSEINSINHSIVNLDDRLTSFATSVARLTTSLEVVTDRLTTVENTVGTMEEDVDNLKTTTNSHTTEIQTNTDDITALTTKVTNLATDDEQNIDNIATKWGITSKVYYYVGDIVYLMVDEVHTDRIGYKLFECLKNHQRNVSDPIYKPDMNDETEYWKPLKNIGSCITELNNEVKDISSQISGGLVDTETFNETVDDINDRISGIDDNLLDITNLQGDSNIVTTVNETATGLSELKGLEGQSTLENAARQAMNTEMNRYRFLLGHESDHFRTQHFMSEVVTTQFVDMSTTDMSSFLKGNTTQSVSKIIEVSLQLYISDNKTVVSAISNMAKAIFDLQNRLFPMVGFRCYQTAYSEIQSTADRTYFAPITGVTITPEYSDYSGGYYIYVTFSVDGPDLVYNDISQFSRIFAYIPQGLAYITLHHSDGTTLDVDVNSTNLQNISFRKVGI